MKAGRKLGAFGLVLAALLGGGAALGAAVGPIDVGSATGHDTNDDNDHASEGGEPMTTDLPAAGLLVSQDGFTFEPDDRTADAGPFAFMIIGADGEPVQAFDLLHDRELHLIVASQDLQQYAHLHPARDAEGRWSVDLPDLPPGSYRAFADFQPRGADQYTLGVDLHAPGATPAAAPLEPSAVDTVDGYDVSLERDVAGGSTQVTVTVRRDGQLVTTEPYLGAAGHLVALRDGDLAYLHVHPLDDGPAGPVRFAVEVPSAGTYALFFDFQVDGRVRTARFVVDAAAAAAHGGGAEH